MVSKDRGCWASFFFLVCYCVCLHVSPGSAGQSLFAGFSRGRSFSGLDLLASCQGPRSDPYMGVRRMQVSSLRKEAEGYPLASAQCYL